MLNNQQIRKYLEICIQEAEKALSEGNYPIGSIIVDVNGKVISQKRNQCSTNSDLTAHAEILNLQEISKTKQENVSLFSSLEPCYGCSFFIARSKINKIYSALKDPHKGGITDLKSQNQFDDFFNKIEIINEPFQDLKEKSQKLMQQYFLNIGKKDKAKFYGYLDNF